MKIAWLAAVQPPYREPMWKELAAVADLEVSFFLPGDRVRHFAWRRSPHYRSAVVRARRVPLPGAVARRFDEPVVVLAPGVTPTILRGADALLVHVWWEPANIWAAVRARMRGIPYLIYAESTLQSRRFRGGPAGLVRSLFFRHAGAVLVPGSAAASAAIADGAPPSRVVSIVNSVDLELYHDRVREIRERTVQEGAPHRFVCVGQLIERKNVGSLIRALALSGGDATLDVAGDGAEKAMLEELAETCGVGDRVRFLGFLAPEEIVALLARTHTLVLPSTEEVYGYTALEAHVAGLQVIVSDRAGVAPNLSGRPGTWVVEPDAESLAGALDEARRAWHGWAEVDREFASPQRAAREIVHAVEVARR